MKKTIQTLALCLAVLMTVTVMPMPAQAAVRHASFSSSRIRNEVPFYPKFLLEIGDMEFVGRLTARGIDYEFDYEKMLDEHRFSHQL